MTERIRFARYAYDRIVEGDFNHASTTLNWLIDRAGVSRYKTNPADIRDGFELVVKYRWFRKPTVELWRYVDEYFSRQMISDLSENEQRNLLRAWKHAIPIQQKRNDEREEKRKQEAQSLSWWP